MKDRRRGRRWRSEEKMIKVVEERNKGEEKKIREAEGQPRKIYQVYS